MTIYPIGTEVYIIEKRLVSRGVIEAYYNVVTWNSSHSVGFSSNGTGYYAEILCAGVVIRDYKGQLGKEGVAIVDEVEEDLIRVPVEADKEEVIVVPVSRLSRLIWS